MRRFTKDELPQGLETFSRTGSVRAVMMPGEFEAVTIEGNVARGGAGDFCCVDSAGYPYPCNAGVFWKAHAVGTIGCGHPSGCKCEKKPLKRVPCGQDVAALMRALSRSERGIGVINGAPTHVLADLMGVLAQAGYVLAREEGAQDWPELDQQQETAL